HQRLLDRRLAVELLDANLIERGDGEVGPLLDLEIILAHVAVANGDARRERLQIDAQRAGHAAGIGGARRHLAADALRPRLEAAAHRQRTDDDDFRAAHLVGVGRARRTCDADQTDGTKNNRIANDDGHWMLLVY